MNDNIASTWDQFDELVMAPMHILPGTVQYQETKRAFYAGAAAMLTLTLEASADPNEDVCVINMELLNQELKDWAVQLATGKA